MSQKEAKARLKINQLLEQAGWRLFDGPDGPATVDVENRVNLGDNFEHTKNGFVDYLLLNLHQRPVAVLEAKREDIAPLSAKEQAREYANSLHVRYVILSNGNTHYLWDMQFGNPEQISSFPTLESLEQQKKWHPDVDALVSEEVNNTYVAESQLPNLKSYPDYISGKTRKDFVAKHKLCILRKYQVAAIQAVQKAAANDKKRFLLEMATGTGKTMTCAAIIKLFLKTGNARRVLFLVDRIELENQAKKAFKQSIGSDYIVKVYKEDKDNWQTAHIVVSTVQSLQTGDKYKKFSPSDFDLIISDEAHRSIGGQNARAVFEYFNGYKIGLTATPKDFLKNTNRNANSEREFERRELLDTYVTFGCETGQPTFRYDLKDGVNDPDGPFLVNPIVYDARTNITAQLLDDQGYAVHHVSDDGFESEERYSIRDFEKSFFNEETNWVLCETFLRYAARDPISGEVGKTIIFTVSQHHAEKITQILNQLAMELFPGKYNSDFAVQITSNVRHAQEYTTQFSENKLRGQTGWLPDYNSSKARAAVTVGMMTTGYDCSDLQNVVFMRPVFSPSDFIQMKGRGTRTHVFKWIDYQNGEKLLSANKESFNIIDFFAVCEYFEEKYDYDAPLVVPKIKEKSSSAEGSETDSDVVMSKASDLYDAARSDNLEHINETIIGKEGMRIDREMFRNFQEDVKANDEFMDMYRSGDIEASLDYLKNHILGEDKPKYYMTPEKIRKIFGLDRRLDLREILDLIINNIEPLTKAEYIKAKFDEFISDKRLGEELVGENYNDAFELFDAYITDPRVAEAIDEKRYGELSGFGSISMRQLRHLGIERVEQIVSYIKDYINVDKLRVKD